MFFSSVAMVAALDRLIVGVIRAHGFRRHEHTVASIRARRADELHW
jgi:hypothetical protein